MSESLIGVPRPRLDSGDKVVGATRYAGDDALAGLLHARLVLSTQAHALITGIGIEAALAVPGVVAVLTADDLPIADPGSGRSHEPLASAEVVFVGHPIALVVAETEAAAADGAAAVIVDYEELEPVLDMAAAMEPGSPLARRPPEDEESSDLESVHAGVGSGEDELPEEDLSDNVLKRGLRSDGDLEAAFAESDAIVSGTFPMRRSTRRTWSRRPRWRGSSRAPRPSSRRARKGRSWRATTSPISTGSRSTRCASAPLPSAARSGEALRRRPLAAGAALALRRPVRVVLTRSEDFHA